MATQSTPFQLPPLRWAEHALDPVSSARTTGIPCGKDHAAYVKKLSEVVAGTRDADMPLDQVVRETAGKEQKIFNNAAQAWNHTFYWSCLKKGAGKPSGDIAKRLDADCGGLDGF